MITVRILKNNVFLENIDSNISSQIRELLSYRVQNYVFSPAYKTGRWDGYKRLYNLRKNSFKIGLLTRVLSWLKQEEIQYEIIDERDLDFNYDTSWLTENTLIYTKEDGTKVYPRHYQIGCTQKVASKILGLYLTRGIFCLPPRSGKTLLSTFIIKSLKQYPVLFCVHRIDLAIQTKKVYEDVFKCKIGLIGDGNFDIEGCDVVVSTIQSINSAYGIKDKEFSDEEDTGHYDEIKEFISRVKMCLIDECHVSSNNQFQELLSVLDSCYYIYGFTGTPFREDGEDMMIEQLCGSIIFELSREEAVESGFLLPVDCYMVHVPPTKVSGFDWKTQQKEALNENQDIINGVQKLVKRLESENLSSVIIVNHKKQGNQIHKKLKCEYLHGGVKGDKRQEVYKKLNDKEILTIVSTVTDIGVDIPSLDCVIIAGLSQSKVASFQRIRCNTPYGDKKEGYLFIFCPSTEIDPEKYDDLKTKRYLAEQKKKVKDYLRNHWTTIIKNYKQQKHFTITDLNWK